MANTAELENMSEINGKPVDAIGHLVFQVNMDHFKTPFYVEKVFGLIDKKTNAVFKFKLVVNEDGPLEIKVKTVDAIGHMVFQISFDHFKSPFRVEKVFGLVNEKTNAVFKFKLVVNEDGPRKIKFKLMYVSEQPIDCKIKINNCPSAIVEHLRGWISKDFDTETPLKI